VFILFSGFAVALMLLLLSLGHRGVGGPWGYPVSWCLLSLWVVVSLMPGDVCRLGRRWGYQESWCLLAPWVLAYANMNKAHIVSVLCLIMEAVDFKFTSALLFVCSQTSRCT
jgi:hypothetical protein